MTDTHLKTLAEEYKRLEDLLDRERAKSNMSIADIRYYEHKMARIEEKFQQADLDIRHWIK
jgi:ribosome assembly protein YihI (activator of Der GTPase)